jgi:hypothetical protein
MLHRFWALAPSYGMPVFHFYSLSLYRACLFCHAKQTSRQKANPRQTPSRQPAQKNIVQRKPAPEKPKGLRLLKETLQASLVQKKPAPTKVENLANEYLAELREVDVTFEKGTAVLEKYRVKYPELASPIREIVPGERRIESLEGEDSNLHLFAIRILEVRLSPLSSNRCVAYSLRSKAHRMCLDKFYARPERLRNNHDLLSQHYGFGRGRESYGLISGRTVLRYPHLKEVL